MDAAAPSPTRTASTSARRTSGSLTGMPCSSARASTNIAVADTNAVISAAPEASDAAVPTPGTAAAAPEAPPIPITAARYCFSSRSTRSAGVEVGFRRRTRSM